MTKLSSTTSTTTTTNSPTTDSTTLMEQREQTEQTEQREPPRPPRVRLPQGTYEGRVLTVGQGVPEGGRAQPPLPSPVDAFLGVPFAQSTAGANRFRAPVALAQRPDGPVHDATRFGTRCVGGGGRIDVAEGEDCLNANVYVPLRRRLAGSSRPLPVVVYVHGGGFNGGLGAERDIASFVGHAATDLVGVSFNYRVGALGFLGWWAAGDDTDDSDDCDAADDEAPLNLGLLDQQALLWWVQANIRFFGGDARNVTLMGLSAGAHSIGHHLQHYAPGAAPFHKAILESGAPTARAVLAPDHVRPLAQLRAFLVEAGVLEPDEAVPPASSVVAALRRLPVATVVRASRAVWDASQASVCWPFQPVVDGLVAGRRRRPRATLYGDRAVRPSSSSSSYIAQTPLDAWRRGHHAHVPVLTGFATHEGTLFVPRDAARADTDAHFRAFFATLVPALDDADLDRLCRLYPDPVADPAGSPPLPPGITGRQWPRLEAAYAHYAYITPVLQTADFVAASRGSPVYVYEFAAHAGATDTANHGDQAPVVAHDMAALDGHPGLLRVADAMHAAWVRFAASPQGDPNDYDHDHDHDLLPRWRPFVDGRASGNLMVFGGGNNERVPPAQRRLGPAPNPGLPAAMRTLSAAEREQCRFWWDRVGLSEGHCLRTVGSSRL